MANKNYAVIYENEIINVIVAESKKIAESVTEMECVECDGSFWIGWKRDGENWIAPVMKTNEAETI